MKPNGALDKAGAITALKPLQKADPELYQKVLKIFVTCGMRGNLLLSNYIQKCLCFS